MQSVALDALKNFSFGILVQLLGVGEIKNEKMNKQRKTSFSQLKRESIPSTSGSERKIPVRATPLMRPSTGKMSLSAAKTSRASMQSEHHIVKDTRPLSDKTYMKRSILALVHFLEELGYPNPLYPKMMNPPTNRDYQRIFEYLVSHVLGSYTLVGKADEEMFKVAKDLGFPFSISKSALNNVGTMSAWPHALGLLTWLVEYVKYVCLPETSQLFSDNPKKQMKLEFLCKSYDLFMRGTDGPHEELISEVKQQLSQLDANTASEVRDLLHSNARLSEDCQAKLTEKESNEHVSDEISTQKNNIDKMRNYFSDIDKYILQLKEKTSGLKKKTLENRELGARIRENISKIKTTISLQTLSATEAERLLRETEELQKSCLADEERLQSMKDEYCDKEIKFGKLINEMDGFVHQHNSEIKKLFEKLHQISPNLLSENLEKLNENDLELETGHNGVKANNRKLHETVMPYLGAISKEFVEIEGAQKNEFNTQTNRILQDKETLDDLESQKESYKQKLDKVSVDIETLQKKSNKQEESMKKQLDENLNRIEQLRVAKMSNVDRETLQEKQKELEALRDSSKQKEEDYEKCIIMMGRKLLAFYDTTRSMIKNFQETKEEMDKDFINRLGSVRKKMADLDPEISKLEEFVSKI